MHHALISSTATSAPQTGHAVSTNARMTDSTLVDVNPKRLSSSTAAWTALFNNDARVGAGRIAISGATSVKAA
ncbi:MAG TPA: hypothetical protein VGQ44_18060 [Gemmatimonadaceae bacterium]|nr:hypothetical protein [Gemmatimonadaceae bacterium]